MRRGFPSPRQAPLAQSGGGGRDLPGRDPPATASSSGKFAPLPGRDPPSFSPPASAADVHMGPANKKKVGAGGPFPQLPPQGRLRRGPFSGTSVPRVGPVTRRDARHGPGLGCPSAARPDRHPRAWPWPWEGDTRGNFFFTPLFARKQRYRQPRGAAALNVRGGNSPGAAAPRPSPQHRVLSPPTVKIQNSLRFYCFCSNSSKEGEKLYRSSSPARI